MSATLSHSQSHLVSRSELMTIPAPSATPTWKPIAHADLITAVERQLLVREVQIVKEQFAIQREGLRLFAVLDLSIESVPGATAAMGIRTSNDQSMALEIAVGAKVFVCDNLAFSGDLIALRRKHTTLFDLNADISRAIDRYQAHLLAFNRQLAALGEQALGDDNAKSLIFDAFQREILPLRFFPVVAETYFAPMPEMTDVHPRTRWGLHNAFTRAIRQMAPAPAFAASTRLGRFFGLTEERS